jgi:hypothetical protein
VVVASVEVAYLEKRRSNDEDAVRMMPTAVEVGLMANWDSNVQFEFDPVSVPHVNFPVEAL